MVVAGVLFAGMGVFVKLGATRYGGAEMVFYRSLFGALVVFATARARGLVMYTPHWGVHVRRSLVGLGGMLLLFYVIGMLPLATATTLNYTSPLFLVVLMVLVFKERPRPWLVVSALLGFTGVVLLLHPTFAANLFVC